MSERADEAYYAWMEQASKFDYFVAGVALAATGYLAAELQPARLGWNAAGLELASVLLLLGSSVAALKRVEATVTITGAMHRRIQSAESAGSFVRAARGGGLVENQITGDVFTAAQALELAQASKQGEKTMEGVLEEWSSHASGWYRWRNRLLYVGLATYVAAQVLAAY